MKIQTDFLLVLQVHVHCTLGLKWGVSLFVTYLSHVSLVVLSSTCSCIVHRQFSGTNVLRSFVITFHS